MLAWPHPQAHDFLDLAGLLLVHVALMEDLGTLLGASLVHLLVCQKHDPRTVFLNGGVISILRKVISLL